MIGRAQFAAKLKELWKAVHNSRYYVKRGAINWSKFDFSQHPFAVAIMFDHSSFLSPAMNNEAIVTFEIFTSMKDSKAMEIEDKELEEILWDAKIVIEEVNKAKDQLGDSIATVFKGSEDAIETYDSDLNVQGLIVTFRAKY